MRPSSRGLLGNAAGGQIGANVFLHGVHFVFPRVVGASPPGFARPPNLSFGLPEFGWYHFAAAPYCAIYMRESVEAMYIYVAVREHLAFVRVRSIL